MKKNLKVAVVQYQIPSDHKDAEGKVNELVKGSVFKGAEMVGLPEECLGFSENLKSGYDPLEFLGKIAKENKVYLFGATYILDENNKPTNVGFLFDNEGKLLLLQRKIVLTPPELEFGFVSGDSINIIDTEFGRIAILVCKDALHRYAAWFFDELMKAEVDIVLVPSSSITVSERSINLWVDTLKTMSMLFNVFIVAPGTVGLNGIDGSQSFGNSIVVSPLKVVLAQGSKDKKEILFATLEKEDLEKLRSPEAAKWQPEEVPEFKITSVE